MIAKVKLLALCLLIEIAYCAFLNAMRLHFDGAYSQMQREFCAFLMLAMVMMTVAMNVVAAAGSSAAIIKGSPHRRFAFVAFPATVAATAILIVTYLLAGSRISAGVALAAYMLLFAIYRFVPGKVWPPDSVT